MVTFGSGINLKEAQKKIIYKQKKFFIFLFIGRFIYSKGLKEFVLMSNNFKSFKNLKFWAVGMKNKTKLNKFHIPLNLLLNWKKNSNMSFYKFSNKINNFINKADCVVLPSYREGMSRSLIEAASAGKILISTNVPGCKEIVKNNYNGFTCKPKNVESLVYAVQKVIQLSKKKKIYFMNNSKKLIINNFNEDNVIQVYMDIINSIKKNVFKRK